MHGLEVACIEVCKGDRLHGYAIFFSGGWDAYLLDGRNSLLCIGRAFNGSSGALKAIGEGYDWRKERDSNRSES